MKSSRDDRPEGIFNDLLFTVNCGFLFLLFLAMIMINPIARDATVKKDADYLITMEWDGDTDCDVDLYVKGPDRRVVSFQEKSNSYMHIERDDLGLNGDSTVINVNGTAKRVLTTPSNKEVWTLRGHMEGEYYVNIHLYSCRDGHGGFTAAPGKVNAGSPVNLPVDIKLMQINPSYVELAAEIFTLERIWQEKSVISFVVPKESQTTTEVVFLPGTDPMVMNKRGVGLIND